MIRRATRIEERFIKETIRGLPPEDTREIGRITVEQILTDEKGIEISGRYEVKKKGREVEIFLNGRLLWGNEGKKTIAHEIGHHVFRARFSREQKEKWERYSDNLKGRRISDIAHDGLEHPFCECYAHYFFNSMKLRREEPSAFAFLEGIYGDQRL